MAQTTIQQARAGISTDTKRPNRTWRGIVQHWQLYAIIALPIVYLIIFHYIPMYGVQIAFKDYRIREGIFGSDWVGLKHFRQFFASPSAWRIIRNTLRLSFYTVIAGFPFPILLALFLNEVRVRPFKKTVQMVTYAPYFISTVVMVGIIVQFLSAKTGIANQIIKAVGAEPVVFLAQARLFTHIYVWSGIWQHAGWGSIIYLAALSSIDPTLYEAAIIDGANRFQRIRHIDIPSIAPTIVILLILNVGRIMNIGFEKVFLMQNPLNLETSEIIQTYVYKIGLAAAVPQYSYGAAIGLFNAVINFVLLLTVNRIAKKLSQASLW